MRETVELQQFTPTRSRSCGECDSFVRCRIRAIRRRYRPPQQAPRHGREHRGAMGAWHGISERKLSSWPDEPLYLHSPATPMHRSSRPLALLFLSLPLLGLSLGFAGHMYGVGRVARSTRRWEATQGIISSGPELVRSRYTPPGYRRISLRYRYSAWDGDHRNERKWSDGVTAPAATAEALAKGMRAGDTVPVYYDPKRPGSSLLFAGQAQGPYAPGSLWAILCAAVPLLLVLALVLAAQRASGTQSRA